jgi:hypothetical protein
MLTDPREALAEQSNFINGLVGLVGLAQVVRALAADNSRRVATFREADDFVYLLLAIASLGEAVGHLAASAPADKPQGPPTDLPPPSMGTRWLR